jgi:hypothetical protein
MRSLSKPSGTRSSEPLRIGIATINPFCAGLSPKLSVM